MDKDQVSVIVAKIRTLLNKIDKEDEGEEDEMEEEEEESTDEKPSKSLKDRIKIMKAKM